MTEQEMLKMPLHSQVNLVNTATCKEWIRRVYGGWIYYRQLFIQSNYGTMMPSISTVSTFVPEREIPITINKEQEIDYIAINKLKNDIIDMQISKWLVVNYDEKHIANSLRKHLNVENISECDDFDRKFNYLVYLKSK